MEMSAASNDSEWPHPLKMCYQALKTKAKFSLKALVEWAKDALVFTLVALFTLGEKPDIHEIWTLSKIWPLRSWIITLQNYRDLNQFVLNLWSKFGDPNMSRWCVMSWISLCLIKTHTDTRTQRCRQRQYPLAKTGLRLKCHLSRTGQTNTALMQLLQTLFAHIFMQYCCRFYFHTSSRAYIKTMLTSNKTLCVLVYITWACNSCVQTTCHIAETWWCYDRENFSSVRGMHLGWGLLS